MCGDKWDLHGTSTGGYYLCNKVRVTQPIVLHSWALTVHGTAQIARNPHLLTLCRDASSVGSAIGLLLAVQPQHHLLVLVLQVSKVYPLSMVGMPPANSA